MWRRRNTEGGGGHSPRGPTHISRERERELEGGGEDNLGRKEDGIRLLAVAAAAAAVSVVVDVVAAASAVVSCHSSFSSLCFCV